MTDKEKRSCVGTIRTLMSLAYNVHGVMDLVDADNCERIIKCINSISPVTHAEKQQPCEDVEIIQVSKGALKSRQSRFVIYDVEWLKNNFYLEEKIYGQPKQPCEDCISRERLLARIDEERKHLLDLKMDGAEHIIVHHARRIIEDMPSVTPQPKKGKWINNPDADYGGGFFICSECGTELYDAWKYCPECGSDNREEADE